MPRLKKRYERRSQNNMATTEILNPLYRYLHLHMVNIADVSMKISVFEWLIIFEIISVPKMLRG